MSTYDLTATSAIPSATDYDVEVSSATSPSWSLSTAGHDVEDSPLLSRDASLVAVSYDVEASGVRSPPSTLGLRDTAYASAGGQHFSDYVFISGDAVAISDRADPADYLYESDRQILVDDS